MRHIHADFLSARDLLALGGTCARFRSAIAGELQRITRARVPHTKYVAQRPRDMLRYIANREARDNHARVFFALAHGSVEQEIVCKDISRQKHKRYVANADLIIRGDLIVDEAANMYVYGNHCGFFATRCVMPGTIDISKVFCIPYEFPITYYETIEQDYYVQMQFKIDISIANLVKRCRFVCDGKKYDLRDEYEEFKDDKMADEMMLDAIRSRETFACDDTRDGTFHLRRVTITW